MLLLLQSTYILAVKKAGYLKIKTKTANINSLASQSECVPQSCFNVKWSAFLTKASIYLRCAV